jgi:hypothetical protein
MHQTLRAIDERGGYRDEPLQHGDPGNYQALKIGRGFILQANQEEYIRALALKIVAQVKGHDAEAELDALYVFCRDEITYRRDPRGQERVQHARYTARTRVGDCLDKVILFCGLAGSLGYVTRYNLLQQHQTREGGYDHVFAEGRLPGKWKSYDPTPELGWAGWRGRGIRNTAVEIYTPSEQLQLAGWLSKLVGIGGIVAAPFTGGASLYVTAGTGLASGLIGAHEQKAEGEKQIGAYFEEQAAALVSLIRSLANKPTLTRAEYDQAAQAYASLDQFAEQYKAIKYVAQKWPSDAYGPTFKRQVDALRARVSGAGSTAGASSGDSSTPWLLLAAGAGALYFATR